MTEIKDAEAAKLEKHNLTTSKIQVTNDEKEAIYTKWQKDWYNGEVATAFMGRYGLSTCEKIC